MNVIDLEAYRRKIEQEPCVPGTLRWLRAMRDLEPFLGPMGRGGRPIL